MGVGGFFCPPYLQYPRLLHVPLVGGAGHCDPESQYIEQNAPCPPLKHTPLSQSPPLWHVAPNPPALAS
jgi:hypothetical protein